MKLALYILLFFIGIQATATTYYVSNGGNDANTGTDSSHAWRTLSKVTSKWSTFAAGDKILLKKGQSFHGSIVASLSGTAAAPITISSYGSGAMPIISGDTLIGGTWTNLGSGLWKSPNVSTLKPELNVVSVNGNLQSIGRYPNANAALKGYLIAEVGGSYTSLTDNNLTSATDYWKGAEIAIRTRNWVIDRSTVTAQAGQKLTYDATTYDVKAGYGYFFQNDPKTLDLFGEWSYEYSSTLKQITMYFGTGTPSANTITAADVDTLINLKSYSYLNIDGVHVSRANKVGVYCSGGHNNRIINCEIEGAGKTGIYLRSATRCLINNSNIHDIYNNGIKMNGGGTDTVSNCSVVNINTVAGMGESGDENGNGIYANGSYFVIKNNKVSYVGYLGIEFLHGDFNQVINNVVDHFSFTKDDGSGIYSYNSATGTDPTGYKQSIVQWNIVTDAVGVKEGTTSPNPSAEGIYMDGKSRDVLIKNNIIARCSNHGLFLNNTQKLYIEDNTFYDNVYGWYSRSYDNGTVASTMDSNRFVRNVVFAKDSADRVLMFLTDFADSAKFGKIDSNWYCRPILEPAQTNDGTKSINKMQYTKATLYSLDRWQGAFSYMSVPYDKNTHKTANTVTSTSSLLFIYNDKDYDSTVSLNGKTYINYKGDPFTSGSTVLRPKEAQILIVTPNVPLDASGNKAPTVTITSPAVNATFTAPATINITATAIDSDGAVVKVQFYNGSTLLATDSSSPYSYSWTGVAAGNYSISAKATDSKGLSTSISRSITVTAANTYPQVTLTSPANNATFTAPASVSITANASDDGTVSKVDFYRDSTLLFSDATSPYAYTWSSVAAGIYSISAKTTDNTGLVTSTGAISITVNPTGNSIPTVNITSPANNATFADLATINISATATDPDGTTTGVTFYNGSTTLGTDNTSPYTFSWTSVPSGTYSITAKATDNLGGVGASSTVVVKVGSAAGYPSITLTSPTNNATYTAPASILLSASATDPENKMASVKFYNGTTLIHTENTAPYSWSWANVAAGTYNISATATDSSGLSTSSGSVTVIVNPAASNVAPVVTMISPANGTQYTAPANISMEATASDADGTVSKVEFFNGSTLLHTETTAPYTHTILSAPAGNYNLTARATDNLGKVTTSSTIAIVVNIPTVSPTISLTSPTNNSTYTAPASISIVATAADADGTIARVEFYRDSIKLGTDSVSPYSYTWTGVAVGSYSITAKATDNSGLVTTSGISNVTVTAVTNVAPTVSITSPTNNASFTQPVNVTINATATDADGTVSKVDFYYGSTFLGTDNTSPFSYTWNNVPVGNYALKAIATDNSGTASAPSTVVNITVIAPNVLPAVSMIAPTQNAQYVAPATVNLEAAASDTDGYIVNVRFYNGTTLLATITQEPYIFSWANVPAGSYSITAVALDNSNQIKTSSSVSISVRNLVAPMVSITAPANNTNYLTPASFTVNATATDQDGTIKKVEFYRGTTLIGTDSISPYSAAVSGLTAGSYQLTAKAFDNDNLFTTSSSINITVNATKVAPTVSITSPSNNATYNDPASISIAANAADADGTVNRVEFYSGTTFIGADYSSPYTLTWSSVPGGTYSITAKAIDNDSLSTISSPVNVVVSHANIPPVVKIIEPATNSTFYKNENVKFTATATDADGTITNVRFFQGSTLLGTVTTTPYTYTWVSPPKGNYTITAKATDNSGGVTTSSPISITISAKPIKTVGYQIIVVP